MRIRDQLTYELEHSDAPPLGTIVANAAAAGRRRQRYRRLGAGAATAVAVVAVVGGVVVSMPGPTGTAMPRPPAAAAPTTKPATGQAVVSVLESSMPPGGTFTEIDYNTSDHEARGGFLYDDGHGAATVSGSVADAPADYGEPGFACPSGGGNGFRCEMRTLADGGQVRIMTMGPYGSTCTDAKCGIKDVRVEIQRAGGTYVIAEAYNGPFGHNRAATRADTVLSTDRLMAIASDPRFAMAMDATLVDAADANIHMAN